MERIQGLIRPFQSSSMQISLSQVLGRRLTISFDSSALLSLTTCLFDSGISVIEMINQHLVQQPYAPNDQDNL